MPQEPQAEAAMDAAAAAVGNYQEDDYKLTPSLHAAQFREKAPSLAGLLESSEVQALAQSYEKADAEAVEARRRFDQRASRARWCVFAAACFTAALLAAGNLDALGPWQARLAALMSMGGLVSGALAGAWLNQIGAGKLIERWLSTRADAEGLRLRYFLAVTRPADAIETRLLQFEYFRRFQLDVQQNYFEGRRRDHERASQGALTVGSWSMAGVALANGLALQGVEWAGIAALGVAGQAFSSAVSNREASRQDTANAERYGKTWRKLQQLRERLDDVRRAAAGGDSESMQQFIEAVHEQLAAEHAQWASSAEQISGAVSKLNARLNELQQNSSGEQRPQA